MSSPSSSPSPPSDAPIPASTLPPPTPNLNKILSSPPFHSIQGIVNLRQLSLLPSDADPTLLLRPGYLYRSGEPSLHLSEHAKAQLKSLGIKKVFDFRSKTEVDKYGSKSPEVEGIEFVSAPVHDSEAYDPVGLAKKLKRFESDQLEAFVALYTEILHHGGPAFELVLAHIRDHPDEPCLVHCTAGKDRTGVFCAILLKLLDIPEDAIAHDYALTTLGLEPFLPVLVSRFSKDPAFKENPKAMMNMASARPETIKATLERVRETYGGVEGYLKSHTSLKEADFEAIRRNLLIQVKSEVD